MWWANITSDRLWAAAGATDALVDVGALVAGVSLAASFGAVHPLSAAAAATVAKHAVRVFIMLSIMAGSYPPGCGAKQLG